MSILEVWLLGIALAMDCFAASIATGVSAGRIIFWPMLRQAFLFGLFQGAMTILGYACMMQFRGYIETIDHWIAFGLLTYLGLKMIIGGLRQEKPQKGKKGKRKSQKSELLTLNMTVIMAIATSIDALAVGISMACMPELDLLTVCHYAVIIALCSLFFSMIGLVAGIFGAKKTNWHIEALGGIILLLIGIKILIEHTLTD